MSNFYTDVPEIKFEMENSPLMQRIVDLKERNYALALRLPAGHRYAGEKEILR